MAQREWEAVGEHSWVSGPFVIRRNRIDWQQDTFTLKRDGEWLGSFFKLSRAKAVAEEEGA